ncbi:MAG: metal ABC transporter ATP-binding protein [Elusimicrobiota bacterium]|jgi:manganese/iron transport system ATP-binding protein
MPAAAVRFEGVSLGYEGKLVLDGVDIAIPAGAFVGVLGANGSGKTTLMRALLGLGRVRRGHIAAFGQGGPARFGYMPQKERLDSIYPITVRAVAAMGAVRGWEFPGRRRPARAAGVERCLEDCGVRDLADKRFGDLSGGQRQRVLMARALAAEPDILVLDEPLAGIDAATRQVILGLLARLRQEGRATVLMVSHHIQAERELFSHVIWVDEATARIGPAAELLASARAAEVFRSGA